MKWGGGGGIRAGMYMYGRNIPHDDVCSKNSEGASLMRHEDFVMPGRPGAMILRVRRYDIAQGALRVRCREHYFAGR